MCIAAPKMPAAAPIDVPSMQVADNLNPGGPQRGVASLGRLALRLNGTAPTAAAPQTVAPSIAVANTGSTTTTSSTGVPAYAAGTTTNGVTTAGVAGSLAALRMGGLSSIGGFGR